MVAPHLHEQISRSATSPPRSFSLTATQLVLVTSMRAFAASVCFLALWSSALATTREEQLVREWAAKNVRKADASKSRYSPPPSTIVIPCIARAKRHEDAGQLQDAISDYKEAVRLDSHCVQCWLGLARLF